MVTFSGNYAKGKKENWKLSVDYIYKRAATARALCKKWRMMTGENSSPLSEVIYWNSRWKLEVGCSIRNKKYLVLWSISYQRPALMGFFRERFFDYAAAQWSCESWWHFEVDTCLRSSYWNGDDHRFILGKMHKKLFALISSKLKWKVLKASKTRRAKNQQQKILRPVRFHRLWLCCHCKQGYRCCKRGYC